MEPAPEVSAGFPIAGWTMLLVFAVGRGRFADIPDEMTIEFQYLLHCFDMMQSSNSTVAVDADQELCIILCRFRIFADCFDKSASYQINYF